MIQIYSDSDISEDIEETLFYLFERIDRLLELLDLILEIESDWDGLGKKPVQEIIQTIREKMENWPSCQKNR